MGSDYTKIIQTGWLTAYPRIFSDIPFAQDFFDQLEKLRKEAGDPNIPEEFKVVKLAPELEARYKLVNQLILKSKTGQILEIASGLSPRGLAMTEDKTIQYVEVDLPEMMADKRKIISELIAQSKIVPRPNLHLKDGSALNLVNLLDAASYFKKEKPITVVNEGLLRYLTFREKEIVAKNIYHLLSIFGGTWITPDITLRKFLQVQDEIMPGKNKEVVKRTRIDIDQNRFENENQAKDFFEKLGFTVERHNFLEIIDELVSPQRLELTSEEVRKMIGSAVVFVMRLKEPL